MYISGSFECLCQIYSWREVKQEIRSNQKTCARWLGPAHCFPNASLHKHGQGVCSPAGLADSVRQVDGEQSLALVFIPLIAGAAARLRVSASEHACSRLFCRWAWWDLVCLFRIDQRELLNPPY